MIALVYSIRAILGNRGSHRFQKCEFLLFGSNFHNQTICTELGRPAKTMMLGFVTSQRHES